MKRHESPIVRMPDRRRHWERRYADAARRPGAPSPFLQELLPSLPPGSALDIASGDGRHSLTLANAGYTVTAIDLSLAGLSSLIRTARERKLPINAVQADLESYPLPTNRFDVAVKVFYLQRDLFGPMKASLRQGGVAVVETFLIDQREIGHPRSPNFLLERGELGTIFADFEILRAEEGLFQSGREKAFLSRLAARKP